MVDDVDRGKLISPPQRSLIVLANCEDLGKGNGGFCVRHISFMVIEFLHAIKSCDMGPLGMLPF
jgi:hypothetical protein